MTSGVRKLHPGGVSIFGTGGGRHFPVARARRVHARPMVLSALRVSRCAARVFGHRPCSDAPGVAVEAAARAALGRGRGLGNPVASAWAWAAGLRANERSDR